MTQPDWEAEAEKKRARAEPGDVVDIPRHTVRRGGWSLQPPRKTKLQVAGDIAVGLWVALVCCVFLWLVKTLLEGQ